MDQAKRARENAIAFEAKKDGLTQRQNGDWTLRLTLQAIDLHPRISQARMGTRYECVLVEKNDDETPVDHVAAERDKWRDLGPVKQAGMRCKEPTFWAWLRESEHYHVANEGDAAQIVRTLCNVTSRADLSKPGRHRSRTLWYQLDTAYQAWKARENA